MKGRMKLIEGCIDIWKGERMYGWLERYLDEGIDRSISNQIDG